MCDGNNSQTKGMLVFLQKIREEGTEFVEEWLRLVFIAIGQHAQEQ